MGLGMKYTFKTVKDLKRELEHYPDHTPIGIMFECTEAQPEGFQYCVDVLDIVYGSGVLWFCHEEDYPGHYSKKKKKKKK